MVRHDGLHARMQECRHADSLTAAGRIVLRGALSLTLSAGALQLTSCPSFAVGQTNELRMGASTRLAGAHMIGTGASGQPADVTTTTATPATSALSATTTSEVRLDVPADELWFEGDCAYSKTELAVSVSLTGTDLDLHRSKVCGHALDDLLERGLSSQGDTNAPAVVESLTRETVDGEQTTYRALVTLREGMHDLLSLAEAVDEAGHHASPTKDLLPQGIGRIVVDTTAPQVLASIDATPVWASPDEDGLVLFAQPATLTLRFSDEAGIRSATLDASSERVGHALTVSGDLSQATIDLSDVPITDALVVSVVDKADNALAWTLAPEVAQVTASGAAMVPNAAITYGRTGQQLPFGGHPRTLLVDNGEPEVSLWGAGDQEVVRDAQTLHLSMQDDTLGLLAAYDPQRMVLSVSKDGKPWRALSLADGSISRNETTCELELELPARKGHEDDGAYTVVSQLRDLAGNESQREERTFVVDTTAPMLDVSFDDEDRDNVAFANDCYAKPRTARLTLWDSGLTEDDLNGAASPVYVTSRAHDGRDASSVAQSPWSWSEEIGAFRKDVIFPADGTYELEVLGGDAMGNRLVGAEGTEVDSQGRYASGPFTIDATAPRVHMKYAAGAQPVATYADVDYFRDPVSVVVEVTDRNLDLARTTVVGSDGRHVSPVWQSTSKDAKGEVTHTATIVYLQEESGADEGRKTPEVVAFDAVGNSSSVTMPAFVVDQTAPVVQSVSTGKEPYVAGDETSLDPYWFFGEQDGVPTTLTFEVADEYPLDAVWVEDPRGIYDTSMTDVRGRRRATLTIALAEGSQDDETDNEYEFRRNIRLFVRDLVGNVCTWSLGRGISAADEQNLDATNVTVDGSGTYPQSIVRDAVAPQIRLSGVESGTCYKEPQVVHVALEERNFDYLTRFDPDRAIVRVTRRSSDARREPEVWDVSASQFAGERPHYGCDIPIDEDGHYEVAASLVDLAGNASATEQLGTFTLDRTKPTLQVAWDNEDVCNGMYYRAPRTATLTVYEHNFDERRISIQTTGVVSDWQTTGDQHVCTVSFAKDATAQEPHRLSVTGEDQAGNELQSYEATPFALDTQAPTVRFRKRVSDEDPFMLGTDVTDLLDGTAFAQAIMPIVEFADEANLDTNKLEMQLVGKRDGVRAKACEPKNVPDIRNNQVVVDWGNLGAETGDEGQYYRLDADDVYTLSARAQDLAGNMSAPCEVTFSVNRYGSNFIVEPMEEGMAAGQAEDGPVLAQAPRVVVHEVNVSGSASELAGDGQDERHTVTKEYAFATSPIVRTDEPERTGYTLAQSTGTSLLNPYEGWTEYTYTIQSGNFGKNSPSDYGDGGQGHYRVDVSSRDDANNHNTTARFWESDAEREQDVKDKTATASFTLDEFGPDIEALELPGLLSWSDAYRASFTLRDDITNGDYLTVCVDGEPVDVFAEASTEPIGPGERIAGSGRFSFFIPAKSLLHPRSVDIQVRDYTGRDDRTQTVHEDGFHVTTGGQEVSLLSALTALLTGMAMAIRRIWFVA